MARPYVVVLFSRYLSNLQKYQWALRERKRTLKTGAAKVNYQLMRLCWLLWLLFLFKPEKKHLPSFVLSQKSMVCYVKIGNHDSIPTR